MSRSLHVPGSLSSALMTKYAGLPSDTFGMNDHFMPVGKPAPLHRFHQRSPPAHKNPPSPTPTPARPRAGKTPIMLAVKIGEYTVTVLQHSYYSETSVKVVGPPSGAVVMRPIMEPGRGGSPRLSDCRSRSVDDASMSS